MAASAPISVTRIQRFSTHDGPGVRTTVFLKGCPLHCEWCHNPETQSTRPQFFYVPSLCIACGACAKVCPASGHAIVDGAHTLDPTRCIGCMRCAGACPAGACEACQRTMTADEILAEVLRDKPFFGAEGGLTLSGGEPMLHGEAALEILAKAKEAGLSTALETCGYFDPSLLERLVPLVDLFLWDVKDTDTERHKRYVGVGNERILANLRALDALGGRTRLRCILVKGVNLDDAHLSALAALRDSLSHCEGIDLLPYHPFGSSKAVQLGLPDPSRPDWIPSASDLSHARLIVG